MKRRLMTQTNLSSESGRSMVEMLGVLAIVGVLSIGSVAGYRFAMMKYQANEIVDSVVKRAVLMAQNNDDFPCCGRDMGLPRHENGFEFYQSCTNYDGYIMLDMEVCSLPDGLQTILSNNLPLQAVGFEWIQCGSDFNCAHFYFKGDLSPELECSGHGALYLTCGGECACLPGWGGDDCSTRL